jgi:hypothetical protein
MACPGKGTFAAYAKGTLSPEIAREVAAHSKKCPACRLYLAEAVGAPKDADEAASPSLSFKSRRRQVHFFDVERDETLPEQAPFGARSPRRLASSRAPTARLHREGLLDGRYELMQPIAEGGMARVFLGRHRELARQVAVKLVLPGHKSDPKIRELFFREARIAASLSHPNITSVIDFGVDEELGFYLIMDLLEGETLRQRMRRQWPSPRLAAELLEQVGGAVRYIHERGIIHCDLKPENLFLTRVAAARSTLNHVKLIDFGLSFRVDTLPDEEASGTVPYMAPERMDGGPPTPACDVYSLGVLLYELIAHRRPYEGATMDILRRQQAGEPPPPPSHHSREADERLDALTLRATARDPAERHASVEAFLFELRAWMSMNGWRPGRAVEKPGAADGAASATAALIIDSPLPFAVFDVSGALRFANAAFWSGIDEAGAPDFAELKCVKDDPALLDAFRHAARGQSSRRGVFVFFSNGRSVHVTLIDEAD